MSPPSVFAYKFTDENGEQQVFRKQVSTHQCNAMVGRSRDGSRHGYRCPNMSKLGLPYCWQHLGSLMHIKLARSQVPEHDGPQKKGVFAFRKGKDKAPVFRKGEKICDYTGEVLSPDQMRERYGQLAAPYVEKVTDRHGRKKFIDSAIKRNAVSHAADRTRTDPALKPNAKFVPVPQQEQLKVIALKDIYPGEEIFLNYGNQYWNTQQNVRHNTSVISNQAQPPPLRRPKKKSKAASRPARAANEPGVHWDANKLFEQADGADDDAAGQDEPRGEPSGAQRKSKRIAKKAADEGRPTAPKPPLEEGELPDTANDRIERFLQDIDPDEQFTEDEFEDKLRELGKLYFDSAVQAGMDAETTEQARFIIRTAYAVYNTDKFCPHMNGKEIIDYNDFLYNCDELTGSNPQINDHYYANDEQEYEYLCKVFRDAVKPSGWSQNKIPPLPGKSKPASAKKKPIMSKTQFVDAYNKILSDAGFNVKEKNRKYVDRVVQSIDDAFIDSRQGIKYVEGESEENALKDFKVFVTKVKSVVRSLTTAERKEYLGKVARGEKIDSLAASMPTGGASSSSSSFKKGGPAVRGGDTEDQALAKVNKAMKFEGEDEPYTKIVRDRLNNLAKASKTNEYVRILDEVYDLTNETYKKVGSKTYGPFEGWLLRTCNPKARTRWIHFRRHIKGRPSTADDIDDNAYIIAHQLRDKPLPVP